MDWNFLGTDWHLFGKLADVALLTDMIWDAYLSNYRKAAYDGWSTEQLGQQVSRQIDVILAGALTRK